MAKWADNLHPGSSMILRSTQEIDGGLHKISLTKCWRRLMKEYLSTLNTRNKWVEEKRNIAHGEVVLIVDPGKPRQHWPLGQIQEVFPGPAEKVRVVRVRTGGKGYV